MSTDTSKFDEYYTCDSQTEPTTLAAIWERDVTGAEHVTNAAFQPINTAEGELTADQQLNSLESSGSKAFFGPGVPGEGGTAESLKRNKMVGIYIVPAPKEA